MKLDDKEQEKVNKLPVVLKMAVNYLIDAINRILNDDCKEDVVLNTMATLQSNASGRYANEDLVNYEQAARILGVSATNRAKTKLLLDLNGVKQVVLHNQKVGFVRAEVVALAERLHAKTSKKRKKH